jgi:hypothetical protein
MLSTRTARAVGINTQIFVIDFHIKVFLDIRHNIA